MNVWMKRCRQQAKCSHCPEPILNGEFMVVCRWYRKTKSREGTPQTWQFFKRFHPQCWIDQAIAELEKIPIVETRGRKKAEMTDETRAARILVLRRRAAVVQRLKRVVSEPEWEQDLGRIIHLGGLLIKLRDEIEPLGGVPKNWI